MRENSVRRLTATIVSAAALAALCAGAALAQADELPEGPGKEDVAAVCTQCHAVGIITQRRRTPEEWAEIMVRMKGLGVMVDDETRDLIAAYLVSTLSVPAAASDD
jgi:cytochrome c5